MIDSLYTYFDHITDLFNPTGDLVYITKYARLALDNAPPNVESHMLWEHLIQAKTQLCLFEDAYAALVECPYDDM
jgi:hypothetical protein